MLVKIKNGIVATYPYDTWQLRRENPNISFPNPIPDEMFAEWGIYRVSFISEPVVDSRTQKAEQNTVPHQEGGKWVIGWSVVDKTAEEVQQYDDNAAQSSRSLRDSLLASTDWLVIKAQETGVAMGQAWVEYRQALRDITNHVNFPHLEEADWPAKPE